MMASGSQLKDSDIKKYFYRLYLGFDRSYLDGCINRAYRDFNRTLHGIGATGKSVDLYTKAHHLIRKEMRSLECDRMEQVEFDRWHHTMCDQLVGLYGAGGFPKFSIGQAQKWVNMTVKYAALIGDDAMPGARNLIPVAHVPIDVVVLQALKGEGLERIKGLEPWSRIKNYETYMQLQDWIRRRYPGSAPLVVEFHMWARAMTRGAE